jgi:hypothetical protein
MFGRPNFIARMGLAYADLTLLNPNFAAALAK